MSDGSSVGWQQAAPGIYPARALAQRVWFDPVPAEVLGRRQPWKIRSRSREPPAANLQSRSPPLASAPLPVQLDFVYRGLGFVLGVIGHKVFAELSKSSGFECSPHLLHQIEIEMQVMNGDEP